MPASSSGSHPVSLEPDQVRSTAHKIGQHGADLGAAHAAAHSEAELAAGGWVGSSAAALGELTTHWQTTTQKHTARVETFSTRMHTVADDFETVDGGNASDLRALDAQIAPGHGSHGSAADPRNL
jgi:WXG100 family type VII secretion target